jgi:hypothetical protein
VTKEVVSVFVRCVRPSTAVQARIFPQFSDGGGMAFWLLAVSIAAVVGSSVGSGYAVTLGWIGLIALLEQGK